MKHPIKYAMMLSIIFLSSGSCKKKDNSINASKYTAKMAGTRLWSGISQFKLYYMTNDTTVSIIDTPNVISQNGNNAIVAFGMTLTCTKIDDISNTVVFSTGNNGINNFMSSFTQLTYYYLYDSMTYTSSSYHHDIGSAVYLHTN